MSDNPRVEAVAQVIAKYWHHSDSDKSPCPGCRDEAKRILAAADAIRPPMPTSIEEVPKAVIGTVSWKSMKSEDDTKAVIAAFLAAWREQ